MTLKFTKASDIIGYLAPFGLANSMCVLLPSSQQISALQALYPLSEMKLVVDGSGNILMIHWNGTTANPGALLGPDNSPTFGANQVFGKSDQDLASYVTNAYNTPKLVANGSNWYNTTIGAIQNSALAVSKTTYLANYGALMTP